ncbi:MAG: DUF423 domain-containing protein [Porticoccaceae bacterium]|jgi:uncharacterized membrane protein YgdD (TMEM256/DUF423 family)|nr:DUF423 domain-containing protein [Porticoccaceae bacterium]MDB2533293.1 DUF423 domain-containing protein [Porticoccaceae bacterium]MDG1485187.1 DUF423 domain-containing protein [Porticoccaceae bacterium]
MNKISWIKIIAISGMLCVALGAFAAHGLEQSLSAKALSTMRTAVLYQFLHTLLLLGIVALPDKLLNQKLQNRAAQLLLAGIVLFSGSLYLLVFTGFSALGMITPIGGLALIAGWLLLFSAAKRPQ